ncbi:MAG: tyrosine-protein phosphatase, partial [Phototrophicaceae bacterium]
MQQLNVIGTYNIRDLGSYPTLGGQRTRKQWLIRSGNLDKLPIASQQQLYDYGVRTIIDIRDEWEVEHYPNVFSDSMDVTYHNLPLLGDALSNDEDWQRESKQYVHLHDLYNKYLEKCKTQIASIISTIATSDAITICHCHAGKDRTGIIVALILSVVGVAHNHIAHDYALSRQEINHLVDEWRQYAIAHDKALDELERGAASDPETILTMLHYIQE